MMGPPRGTRRRRPTCLFAPGRIGDFVLALSALRLLARETGDCTLVTRPELAPLAARELPDMEVLALPGEAPGLLRHILPAWWRDRPKFASHRFDRKVALCHYRSFFQEIVFSWIDADRSVFVTDANYPVAAPDGQCTELQAHRLVASAALGREVGWDEIVPRFTSFPPGNDGRLLAYPLSQDSQRSIPVERTVALLQARQGAHLGPIVLGGSPRDLAALEDYAARCRTAGLENVAVEAPAGVPAFIEHLAAAGAVLAADSAAAHAAIAFDKPAVVITPRVWHGLALPWSRSARQRTFIAEDPPEAIAEAMRAL